MAHYLIGDIQGCYEALRRLLDKIAFDPASDRLLSCGDLVNRGGQSLEVLRLLHGLGDRLTVTLGNHDLYLLSQDVRFADGNSRNTEIRRVLTAPDREVLLRWLRRQSLAHWSDSHQLLLVHAGVLPQWSAAEVLSLAGEVEQELRSERADDLLRKINKGRSRRWKAQRTGVPRLRMIANVLTRIRFCDPGGKILWNASGPPGSQPWPYQPWYRHRHRLTREVRMAFGHWAALGFKVKKRFIALDSGCVWGGRLTAYRLEDEQVYQVPGKFR